MSFIYIFASFGRMKGCADFSQMKSLPISLLLKYVFLYNFTEVYFKDKVYSFFAKKLGECGWVSFIYSLHSEGWKGALTFPLMKSLPISLLLKNVFLCDFIEVYFEDKIHSFFAKKCQILGECGWVSFIFVLHSEGWKGALTFSRKKSLPHLLITKNGFLYNFNEVYFEDKICKQFFCKKSNLGEVALSFIHICAKVCNLEMAFSREY